METEELTPAMQDLLARMTSMQTELAALQARANSIIPPVQPQQPAKPKNELTAEPQKPAVSSSRRKALRKLAGGLVAGVGILGAGVVLPGQAEAKIVARAGRVGVIAAKSGDSVINNIPGTSSGYGLLAIAGTGVLDLSDPSIMPDNNIGVMALSDYYGVYGAGDKVGVVGVTTLFGGSGVEGYANSSNSFGVKGTGDTGVYGKSNGSGIGVYGIGSTGVYAFSVGAGTANPALNAVNNGLSGIAAVFSNLSNDTTVLISNVGTGPLLKAWGPNGAPRVEITNGGLIKANGGFQTGGADLAEVIPCLGVPEPGDVVEIDPENAGKFRRCTTPGSTGVAGVISTTPGMVLGEPLTSENAGQGSQLALVGRIPVKVTGEGGPIRPGDLLIASSTPGHAMLASNQPGTGSVIGKALGNFENGEGLIEMLVMLR